MDNYKMLSASELVGPLTDFLQLARRDGQKIILVTGVFDIIHSEHRKFLAKAKALGGKLVAGIESDHRVAQIKGPNRPKNPEQVRRARLVDEGLVDLAFILPEEFSQPEQHRQLIESIQPDFLAVSSHTSHLDKKQKIVESVEGQLKIVHQHNPAISTSKLLGES